ncbi:hypothetical protein ACFX12_022987 [Malus domestica]
MLHCIKGGLLDWPTRFKIALDAAEGLSYLHHDCVPAIVHRDVKSNNILLDGDFGARVADFEVAKMHINQSRGFLGPQESLTQLQIPVWLSLRHNPQWHFQKSDLSPRSQSPSQRFKRSSAFRSLLQGNLFSGEIPEFVYSLHDLVRLNLASNNFSSSFPTASSLV